MKNFRAFSRGLPVVKPAWILESVVANKLLSCVPYQLRDLACASGKQPKLSSFFACQSILRSIDTDDAEESESCAKLDDKSPNAAKQLLPLAEDDVSNCNKQDELQCFSDERICEEETAEAKFADLEDEQSVVDAADSSTYMLSNMVGDSHMENNNCSFTNSLGAPAQEHSTLGDPNFVENYFKSSRLHFIGTWRNRYRKRFGTKLRGAKHINANANSNSTGQQTSIIHIDMDCFFVSVVIRNYPELFSKPVAVCHSDSPKGTAEISSANYPAREYGLKAGMFVRDAKARCPDLVIIPYDFEAYEEVADQFYNILHKHCNKVQAVSCDEAFLDVTESIDSDPEHLALVIRKEIAETTGCTASAGIAENMLLARLATRSAKPNGQYFIHREDVDSYLKDLPIKALPGIGHSLGEKLECRQIHTCGQLCMNSKETLQKEFGLKTGEMLWNFCRGIDNRVVEVVQETKSVGAEVNWGVRFNNIADCEHFLLNLCKEVSFRMQVCGVEGRTITLKVKKRRKGAEEPAKFMGCGDCESFSRSMTLPLAMDDINLLDRIAKQIFLSFHIDVKEIRGVGLHISRLKNVDVNRRGRERNTLESWLASYRTTREQRKETTGSLNLSNDGCQPGHIDESLSSRLSSSRSTGSHENRTLMLPALYHLDIEVIRNLPPEIFSEMNDMYNGKLCDFMKKYNEEGKANANFADNPLAENKTTSSSGCLIMGSDADCHMNVKQSANLQKHPAITNKGKQPLCSPDLPVHNIPFHTERTECAFDNAPTDFREASHGNNMSQVVETSKNYLWLGKPPKWVEMFRVSNCFLLNAFACMYSKCGRDCNLSSILQSLLSHWPSSFDLSREGWDEAFSSLCELIYQYIDLKIESDVEELYICFRLLKRSASTSKFLSEIYNMVLPPLQVSVNEHYGGQLQLSM